MSSTVSQVSAVVFGCLAVANFVLPSSLFLITLPITLVACSIAYFIYQGWESSEPNQWLLIIENGKLIKAGVGLKYFRWYN